MHHFLRALVGLFAVVAALPGGAVVAPAAQADDCQFVLGFKTLRDLIPTVVGNCLTDEQHGANGDGLQPTTSGLLVWRKADNYTAFTDGYQTWVNGPLGLQERLNTQRFDWEKKATVPSTQVIAFTPPQTMGLQASGSCFTSSLALTRTDAWRCMSGNLIFDPCFSTPGNSSAVICVRNPLDSSTFVTLNLTQPLPSPASAPAQIQPWFLQLADGTTCNFFTGATGAVNGQRINYGCSDGRAIVGYPQQGTIWTANEVMLAPRSLTVQTSVQVEIATAWE
jgi:hypothetical protein